VNILFLDLNLIGKGSFRRALRFGQTLAPRGHNITLLATSPGRRSGIEKRYLDGVMLLEMPDLFSGSLRSGWDLWNTVNRIAQVRKRKFHMVHAIQTRPTVLLPALYAKHILGARLIFDWVDWLGRGGSVEERPNPSVRAVLRPVETFFDESFRACADGTVTICTKLREKALALGVPQDRILLLPDGADTHRFSPADQRDSRRKHRLPLDAPIVGHVGTIFLRDAHLMAKAFDLVFEQMRDARLLIIGYCPFDIARFVRRPETVIQTGFVEDQYLNDYLSSCNLCLLPLKDTGANRGRRPLKLNDYMAAGLPTVATGVGDVTELFETEGVGLLAQDTPASLADQIVKLLNNQALQRTMGQRAFQVAKSQFDWIHLTDQLESFYQRVAKDV
jgi:glycosyltransferase involved in cell wall biosynthesis